MLRPLIGSVFAVVLFVISLSGSADDTPEHFISQVSDRLQIGLTEAKKSDRLEDVPYIDALINREVIPYVQLDELCKRIFREHWKVILQENRKEQAINAVISSLKRTYYLAVTAYDGQKIEITDSKHLKHYSIVRIKINTDGDNHHTIDFAVRKFDSEWKMFDFSIDGVGVSKTLNSAIGQQIEDDGLEQTINTLNQSVSHSTTSTSTQHSGT